MIHKMFTIFDSKAEAFLPPFFLPTKAMAVRVFTDCVNDEEHNWGKHPEDYTLFQLGNWNDSSAVIEMDEPKIAVGNGMEFRIENINPLQNVFDLSTATKEDVQNLKENFK